MTRTAFFISDSTGITAEMMGESLLTHFPDQEIDRQCLPFVDTTEKALEAVKRIDAAAEKDGAQPIVIETLINEDLRKIIQKSGAHCIDVISPFLKPLGHVLGDSTIDYTVGRQHVATENRSYSRRIEAIHFALDNDDGGKIHRYKDADLILVGVSRSGKTPTSLYLAMQFGIFCANYPITEDDLDTGDLPKALKDHRKKVFGLTISPDRLSSIRNERLANSRYASIAQCESEVDDVEMLFARYKIPYIDTTVFSIEEISTRILATTGIERHAR